MIIAIAITAFVEGLLTVLILAILYEHGRLIAQTRSGLTEMKTAVEGAVNSGHEHVAATVYGVGVRLDQRLDKIEAAITGKS